MGSEVGGLSTSLGLFASPPLILSTDSVVVMEWKSKSTSVALPFLTVPDPQTARLAADPAGP